MFERDDSTGHLIETAKLTASDGAASDGFGYSVSISDNIAIIGARYDDDKGDGSGSAYVFEKDVSTGDWNEAAKLTASDGEARAYFGSSVSISGNIAIVGALFDDDNGNDSGSSYVFERDDSTGYWNETVKFTASDEASEDYFGHSVSVSGNVAIVSAHYDDDKGFSSGSVYAFDRAPKYS